METLSRLLFTALGALFMFMIMYLVIRKDFEDD